MISYPIQQSKKDFRKLTPLHNMNTSEFNEKFYDLCLNETIQENSSGELHKYFRLHAKQAHTTEMALAYDIFCPCCSRQLKPVGRMLDANDLFLYECPSCSY